MESDAKIKVMIAMHEVLLRNGIAATVTSDNMEVVAQNDGDSDSLDLVTSNHPHVLIMSDGFSDISGPDFIRQVKNIYSDVGILVISPLENNIAGLKALLNAGASSCLPLYATPVQLLAAIKSVYHGQTAGCFEIVKKVIAEKPASAINNNQNCPLNWREHQILELAGHGMTNKIIGRQLAISDRTVDSYFRNIFSKLSVNTRTEALYKALKNNWVEL